MHIEQYQPRKTRRTRLIARLVLAASMAAVVTGCKGTAPSFTQAFGGLTAPARVPPPAQGSFQVPGSYSGGAGTSASPAGSGLGGSSFGNSMKTSQNSLPTNNLFNSISNAQSQVIAASNNLRNNVNRTADEINSSVELASARADRFSQAGAQSIAAFSEAAAAPLVVNGDRLNNTNYPPSELPPVTNSISGRIGDSEQSDNASWRTPVRR